MKARSTIYIILAWIIIIIAIVVGIIIGSINPVKTMTIDSYVNTFNNTNDTFNVILMLYIWLIGFVLGIFVMGIGSICHRLDLLIDKD